MVQQQILPARRFRVLARAGCVGRLSARDRRWADDAPAAVAGEPMSKVPVPRDLAQPLREVILGAITVAMTDMVVRQGIEAHSLEFTALAARRQALEELLGQFGFDAKRAPARIEIDRDRHGQLMSEILAPFLDPSGDERRVPTEAQPSSHNESLLPIQALRDFMAIVESPR